MSTCFVFPPGSFPLDDIQYCFCMSSTSLLTAIVIELEVENGIDNYLEKHQNCSHEVAFIHAAGIF